MKNSKEEALRKIPKIDTLMKNEGWMRIVRNYPPELSKKVLKEVVAEIREKIKLEKLSLPPTPDEILSETEKRLKGILSFGLKRVINATGIIVHTNLGRSLLAEKAVEALIRTSRYYTNLEYDLKEGRRGDRYEHCSHILKTLTGVEDAVIVNNNAAAVYLVLNTLAENREVIVSRGELVEIGGSFRIPDVMKRSGARIKEVGTTNRTRLKDYEDAISPDTALIMKVHTSNFVIKGFTETVKSEDLKLLSDKYGIPFYYDTGSGLLSSINVFSENSEPNVIEEAKKGISVISFSGDKLLGGPQAGVIIGKKEYIERMKKNPLIRALRPDKMTLAALEATLYLYLDENTAKNEIPTLRMITYDLNLLKKRVKKVIRGIKSAYPTAELRVEEVYSEVGGGSLPEVKIPSVGFSVTPKKIGVNVLYEAIRSLETPIVARIEKEKLIFDMRTVQEEEDTLLVSEIVEVLKRYEKDG
ncbi:MAG: L-seryl-tRNA(Sec) selenium transferase [Desulfobacterota bacterium]|nr:L-seryl-tRNA(Sec) selenium transferase [Thermodesulfobacteriota bacterium]